MHRCSLSFFCWKPVSAGCGRTSSENCTYFESVGSEVGDCTLTICKVSGFTERMDRRIGKCQNWKVSESKFCPFWKKLESVRIGKCQNWKVSELDSVRIGKCQNWKVSESESVRIRKCQNRKVSELESVRIGKSQNWKVSELESVRIFRFFKYGVNDAWVAIVMQTMA